MNSDMWCACPVCAGRGKLATEVEDYECECPNCCGTGQSRLDYTGKPCIHNWDEGVCDNCGVVTY